MVQLSHPYMTTTISIPAAEILHFCVHLFLYKTELCGVVAVFIVCISKMLADWLVFFIHAQQETWGFCFRASELNS